MQLPEVKKMAQQETRNPIRKRWTEKLKMLKQMAEVKEWERSLKSIRASWSNILADVCSSSEEDP